MPSLGNTTYTADFEEVHGVKIEDYVKGVQDDAASVAEVEEADTESSAATPSKSTPETKVVTPPATERTPAPSGPDVKTA